MFTVGDLKRALRGYDDDIPILLNDMAGGYSTMESVGNKRVVYQGCHCESGEWGDIKNATQQQIENGSIFVVVIY